MRKLFKIKSPTFERLINEFMKIVASRMIELFVDDVGDDDSMSSLIAFQD